ncbi:LuxR C-terminal-related transcriptional regulator [Saccharopolyspora sp. K220]|uniref:LuxR C-terminal-related transcriptional regulator n=1 Tax=Saccharopolyspora soli TaxID=2926618 RepID=UPI001F592B76|nr:LuxR C-terminal-related transcriptional regulator [Saccharopolyspora soli]MCI2422337.1 LuxR C-terminal-related transcriptional regulator [Saccharopolyspora soli]
MSSQQLGNLPAEVTTFIGRRGATADAKRALSTSRLVTLTGVGGIGKSRLALHIARELRRAFADGVWLVELATLRDSSLLGDTVATALGLSDLSNRDPETVLASYLADKQLLLVLDNCDHLLDGSAHLTARLLRAAAGLRVLATSREPMGITGEYVRPVPPLSLPAPDASSAGNDSWARRYEALMLFEQRAAAVVPGFTLSADNEIAVARLCRRLDGLPLAIELAAVQLRALTVTDILAHLEDRFRLLAGGDHAALSRHQTLRAAVEWSFDLCTQLERTLWARLSVFADEFDLSAAEHVCTGEGLLADDVFTGIVGLVDKSLLTKCEGASVARYRMLETIRQYGREELGGEKEVVVRRRHRDYYLRLAEESDAESCGPHQKDWGDRLHAERTNFWAALEYCLSSPGEERTGLRLAAALWFYWVACGFVRDGRQWLDRALAADTEPTVQRARALWITGWIACLQGDNAASLQRLREAMVVADSVHDDTELTYAIQFLGDAEKWAGNLPRAVELLDDALSRYEKRTTWTAPALLVFTQRAQAAGLLGDVELAVELRDKCHAICAKLGERWVLSWTEWNLSVTWWAAGDLARAAARARNSLRLKRELNDRLGIPFCVEVLAWTAVADGEYEHAAVLLSAVTRMWNLIGSPLVGLDTLLGWSAAANEQAKNALGAASYDAATRLGAELCANDVIARALGEMGAPAEAAAPRVPSTQLVLTKREQEVAALVAQGMSNKDIAATLVISQRTAEAHVEHILAKLGFTSRAQIATWIAGQQHG